MSTPGSAYGFAVEAPRPLQFLRHGGAEGVLHVTDATGNETCHPPDQQPLVRWRVREGEHAVEARLDREGAVYRYSTRAGVTEIDPSVGEIRMPPVREPALWEEHLWSLPTLLCCIHRGDVPLHAATVEFEGGALLLAGPGRVGKTTVALACHAAGYRVLGEDTACCRLGREPTVFPGPALLRVRPDVSRTLPQASDLHVVYRHPTRVYLAISESRRGSGTAVPILGLVLLRRTDGDPRLERVVAARALPDLMALNFRLPGRDASAIGFTSAADLASRVPIWNLHRRLDFGTLHQVPELLAGLAGTLTSGRD